MLQIMNNYSLHKINGISLVITIVLLAILSIATIFLINMSLLNLVGSEHIIINRRATQAAKSGIEWALFNIVNNGTCFNSTTLTINQGGLKGFNVHLDCNSDLTSYNISATAFYGVFGNKDYVEKNINLRYPVTYIN